MIVAKWKDPPTIEAVVERMLNEPGRWMLVYVLKNNNSAACKTSRLRKTFGGIEFAVKGNEIYGRARNNDRQ